MNLSDWESRLARLKVEEAHVEAQLDRIQSGIAECFVNIEAKRRREVIAKKKAGRRGPKALADVTYRGKEIDGNYN